MRDKFKDIVADTDGDYEAIAEHYMEIYAGTSLTEDQVWEEMICDSLADMNIFSKSKSRAEAAEVMSTAIPAIQQAVSETKTEATKTDAQVEGKASRETNNGKIIEETELYERREETRDEFTRVAYEKNCTIIERGETAFAYRTSRTSTETGRKIHRGLQELGIKGIICDFLASNRSGITTTYKGGAGTLGDLGVFILNDIEREPNEVIGHEAFHYWKNIPERNDLIDVIVDNTNFASPKFVEFVSKIEENYFVDEVEIDGDSWKQLNEEIYAYIYGNVYSGDIYNDVRPFLRNYDEVKNAVDDFLASQQNKGKASRELDLDYDENIEATKTLTNRDILVNALENVTQSQDELDKLREYKKNIEQLNKKTFVLGKLKEEIKAMSFGKGQRDTALPQNQPQQQKASPGIDCRERLSFLEDIMDKASLLEFLSERNLQLHSEYLENCRMRLSILEKSGYSIGGKSYPELFRARLGGARDEILPFAREVYLHELYFDSFGMVGECAECLKSSYRSVAGFLYELECAAMAADGGFLLVTRGKSGVSISHNTGITSRLCAEPRLAIDLAEHAYFLDYGFDKLSYVRSALSRFALSKLDK